MTIITHSAGRVPKKVGQRDGKGDEGGGRSSPKKFLEKKPSLKHPGYVSPLLPSERGARSHGGTGNCN